MHDLPESFTPLVEDLLNSSAVFTNLEAESQLGCSVEHNRVVHANGVTHGGFEVHSASVYCISERWALYAGVYAEMLHADVAEVIDRRSRSI